MYVCIHYSINGYALSTLCAVQTYTSLYVCSIPCKSSVPRGHGMAPLWGQGHDRSTLKSSKFLFIMFESRKLCLTKVVGAGSVWVNFLSNCVQPCWKTALRFSAVSEFLLSYCASERRKNVKLVLKSNLHIYPI